MAKYSANYTNDFGFVSKLALINIYLKDLTTEQISGTTKTFDAQYLPAVLSAALNTSIQFLCEIPNGTRTIRHVNLYVGKTEYLYVPLPFMGGSTDFKMFFDQLRNDKRISVVELVGEHLDPYYTKLFALGKTS